MSGLVVLERSDEIATVILNRPQRLNALTYEMWQEVGRLFTALEPDDGLRCIILRGAGGKAFAPGADIAEFAEKRSDSAQARDYGGLMHRAMQAIDECRHPTVAAIEGVCVGGGIELAMLCDIRICGEGSRFGVPINRIGVTMAYPEIGALIARVGRQTALEILLEGRVFGAAEALAKGLVSRVVADDKVLEEAFAAADRIAAGAPLVNRWHKKFARRLMDPAPLSPQERDEPYQTFDTEDFREGYQAFLAKKTPMFKGK
ncbi:MAG TPA: enoyl-CoA hydratase-related protein [Stellaceae bacterium]|jgi:enoyl-CoA hydratase/carnithine racemase|nr:enoyl-CoA hydratase-related protein [Stellaceae bacterium]